MLAREQVPRPDRQVPCYNLERLHGIVKHDLPPTPNGFVETWRARPITLPSHLIASLPRYLA
jgi:hypothetical protein